MSQSQSLDLPDPASLDGLDQMFSQDSAAASTQAEGVKVHRNLPSDLFTRGFEGVDELVSEEMDQHDYSIEPVGTFDYAQMRANAVRKGKLPPKPGPVARNVRADELLPLPENETTALENILVSDDDRVSRSDLVTLLESFVSVLRKDGDAGAKFNLAKAQQLVAAQEELKFHDIRVEDKTQELEEMRRLVIEAQETIIKLLTDRVEDRARIATLETELRLLPDLQDQADRAMSVAFKTEEFRSELHKVKFELERYRLASARGHVQRGPRFWISRARRWFLKAQGLKLQKFSDATRKIESD
jgi:hypothetical protein